MAPSDIPPLAARGVRLARIPRGTPLGRRAGLVGMGLLFAGFNTGNNLFYLIFTVMAASELVGFWVAGRVLRRLEVSVIVPRRARVGAPLRVTVRVRNTARRAPAPSLAWKVSTDRGETAEVLTPAAPAGESVCGTGRILPARRGRLQVSRLEAASEFPLGLARRIVHAEHRGGESLISPALVKARVPAAGTRRGDLRSLAHPKGAGEEPLEAREYLPGDDARRIDWKASARSERLMWRVRRGDPPRALRVRLDRSGLSGDSFEQRVSCAAGTAVAALSAGRPVGFESDELELLPRSGPAQKRRILDYLALVEPHGSSDGRPAADRAAS